MASEMFLDSDEDLPERPVSRRTFAKPSSVGHSKKQNNFHCAESRDAHSKMKHLELLLSQAESECLELQDRVHALEGHVTLAQQSEADAHAHTDLQETLGAKDRYISELESEVKALKSEVSDWARKNKSRRVASAKHVAETRQQASLDVMELRDEIERLTDENAKLLERIRRKGGGVDDQSEEDDSLLGSGDVGSHHTLIVELSTRLKKETDRAEDLQEQLDRAEKELDELRSSRRKRPDSERKQEERGSSVRKDKYSGNKTPDENRALRHPARNTTTLTQPPSRSTPSNKQRSSVNITAAAERKLSAPGKSGRTSKPPAQSNGSGKKAWGGGSSPESGGSMSPHPPSGSKPRSSAARPWQKRPSKVKSGTETEDALSVGSKRSVSPDDLAGDALDASLDLGTLQLSPAPSRSAVISAN